MFPPFRNEPYVDFSQPAPRERMLAALDLVRSRLGQTWPLQIDGQRIDTSEKWTSVMPASYDTPVGYVAEATADHAEQAIQAAWKAFPAWSRVEPEVRARILVKAAAIMRRRIYELSAWECFEESKSWIEAYADVCEAIDFLEYYARQMVRLAGPQPVEPYPGEENELRYLPLGVVAVIPPWNFPLAITCGMTSSALVTGNTVVLKPARQSPVVAALMVDIFNEAGVPPGVLNFVPGEPTVVGRLMVDHPLTRLISFTGSKRVGLEIFERAARVHPGQKWLKRTVLEMGGKDAIIVDETADLDAAVEGVVTSAFGFQGQKCSACSRLILVRDIYDEFLGRVVERARTLTIGDTTQPENYFMGALIDDAARKKSLDYIEIGRKEGRVVLADGPVPGGGYFVPPTIFADVDRNARIAQEEIFGPVLAVLPARDFDDALEIANSTEYGLTGAVYSRDRMRLERARHEFHVGNLYFNRKCTGALVGVQPFGGFNMSGTDSKAGGADYLLLFLQAKSISERW